MKNILALLIFSILGCSPKPDNKDQLNEKVEVDTIYTTSPAKDPCYQKLILVIKDAFDENQDLNFDIGKTDTLKIYVPRFEEHQLQLKNEKNVKIEFINSDSHLYGITPLDSSFEFEVILEYDVGTVVYKYQKNDSTISTFSAKDNFSFGVQKFETN